MFPMSARKVNKALYAVQALLTRTWRKLSFPQWFTGGKGTEYGSDSSEGLRLLGRRLISG